MEMMGIRNSGSAGGGSIFRAHGLGLLLALLLPAAPLSGAELPRVFHLNDFMMPYCVLGVTKVAREQGEWAAQTALAILNGRSPAAIPLATNVQTRIFTNDALARRIEHPLSDRNHPRPSL